MRRKRCPQRYTLSEDNVSTLTCPPPLTRPRFVSSSCSNRSWSAWLSRTCLRTMPSCCCSCLACSWLSDSSVCRACRLPSSTKVWRRSCCSCSSYSCQLKMAWRGVRTGEARGGNERRPVWVAGWRAQQNQTQAKAGRSKTKHKQQQSALAITACARCALFNECLLSYT